MKFLPAILPVIPLFVASGRLALAQSFINLDFENPILPLTPVNFEVPTTSAMPRWTAYLNGNSISTVGYDTISLGGAAVFLEDINTPYGPHPLPIQGDYSVFVQGPEPGLETSAAIGQTGTIPNTAQSLTFFANVAGNLQITFNGQNIPYGAIGNGSNYTIYGANIASYAGKTGELLFTTPTLTSALLDNIQFSSLPIPEPSILALGALGALLLGFRRRRNFPR